ncbi:MAG: hypothetical protein V4722_00995 [Bacteroidota bacterium]
MEDIELKQMWQAYDQKLDKLLVLNLRHFEQLQTQKASAKINAFVRTQVVGIVLGVLWVAFLAVLVYNSLHNLWFTISVGAILLFNLYAVIAYVISVVHIRRINLAGSITETQEKLASVRSSLNQTGRILVLQAPFYCTWFIHPSMYENITGMCFTLGVALAFLILSVWIYKALAPTNKRRKWIRNFENSFGGKTIVDATDFLGEIDAFKKENRGPGSLQ